MSAYFASLRVAKNQKHSLFIVSGKTAQVRAVGAFSSFAEARISYTNVVGTRATRQADLSKQYYFNCQCDERLMCNPGSEERQRLKLGSVLCPGCKKSICVIPTDKNSRTGQITSVDSQSKTSLNDRSVSNADDSCGSQASETSVKASENESITCSKCPDAVLPLTSHRRLTGLVESLAFTFFSNTCK